MDELRRHLEMEKLFGADFVPKSDAKPEGDFESFRRQVLACRACGLCETRTQVVFGAGTTSSPVVFVGEGPGREEDEQGVPFVGRAGQLLTKVMLKLGVRREQVYIANVVKCRPPDNRVPTPEEARACMPYLLKQIKHIQPKAVCALGATAAKALLNTQKMAILSQRGKYVEINGMNVFLTLHPSYCLRNPGDTYMLEDDLRKLFKDVGLLA